MNRITNDQRKEIGKCETVEELDAVITRIKKGCKPKISNWVKFTCPHCDWEGSRGRVKGIVRCPKCLEIIDI